ncbi:hypothetical protein GJ744_009091 [Endocarpon pusillum]|uniref:Uncharacterized protein n=1 Tax=Endocarpon pusillum TaxID=364733 RepID=A0A8H7E401_9EURO|nr:hypothetical protein GJ744_009091 [Endocarpon pusillum]
MPGLLFPTDLFDRKREPNFGDSGGLYKRVSVRVLIDDEISLSFGTVWSSSVRNSSFGKASTTHESLIVSRYGEVLQGQFRTPYFLRNGAWITPAYSGVVANSVTRRYALENGLCKEGIVLNSSPKNGEDCWLSDGVRGFFQGTICLDLSTLHGSRPEAHSNHDSAIPKWYEKIRSEGAMKSTESAGNHPDYEDDDELQTIPNLFTSSDNSQAVKRPNPSVSSSPSPPLRPSKRGQQGFTPLLLQDKDDTLPHDGYKVVPNPEHRGRILRPRPLRPSRPACDTC